MSGRTMPVWIEQRAIYLLIPLPIALMYSRLASEIVIGSIDLLFLFRCLLTGNWAWVRHPAIWLGAAWWVWVIVCSLPLPCSGVIGLNPLLQAFAMGRFLVFAAALALWLLRTPEARSVAARILAFTACWIILECLQQYLFGSNINGFHRWKDGALTGPFRAPRAGPELILILFPAIMPVTLALLADRRVWRRIAGGSLFALGILTVVLIGQRMPALLTGLGLLLCCFVLPRLRRAALAAMAAAIVLILATPIVSPPTFHKLVVHFSDQMRHFPQSDYGQLYIRATVMGLRHPWTGLGFDGFREHCEQAQYRRGIPALGVPDALAQSPAACNIHPHNHYLEALTESGFPGLLLFFAAVSSWLFALAHKLGRGDAIQAGCFIGAVLAFWPLASTSAMFTLPNAGWIFLVLGLGLAAADPFESRRVANRGLPSSHPA